MSLVFSVNLPSFLHAVLQIAVIAVAPAFPVLSMAFQYDESSLHVFDVF